MTRPLALLVYEKLLPGSQLVNKLQDLNYRVETISEPKLLVPCAKQSRPLVVLVDLECPGDVNDAILKLRQNPATEHVPVIGFNREKQAGEAKTPKAQNAGITLTVGDAALLNHLPQLLDQALQVE